LVCRLQYDENPADLGVCKKNLNFRLQILADLAADLKTRVCHVVPIAMIPDLPLSLNLVVVSPWYNGVQQICAALLPH
jgi:hypothetical protein